MPLLLGTVFLSSLRFSRESSSSNSKSFFWTFIWKEKSLSFEKFIPAGPLFLENSVLFETVLGLVEKQNDGASFLKPNLFEFSFPFVNAFLKPFREFESILVDFLNPNPPKLSFLALRGSVKNSLELSVFLIDCRVP